MKTTSTPFKPYLNILGWVLFFFLYNVNSSLGASLKSPAPEPWYPVYSDSLELRVIHKRRNSIHRRIQVGDKLAIWIEENGKKIPIQVLGLTRDSIITAQGVYVLKDLTAVSPGRYRASSRVAPVFFGLLAFPAGFIIGILASFGSGSGGPFFLLLGLFIGLGVILFHLPKKYKATRFKFEAVHNENNLLKP